MFFIYKIITTILFIIILPFWLVLGLFKPKLVAGFNQKLGLYQAESLNGKKNIVFYGVSVGEVIAMENLIKKARQTVPEINITLLTGTKTGQEIAQKKLSDVCNFISYFPLDFPFCINNFVKKINPSAVFVMETELWPNFANIMNKKKIPLYIINGRISDRTYKSYKKLSFFFKPVLRKYTSIFTQSKQDNEKLISIGAEPKTTEIMGNLKFDIKKPDTEGLGFAYNPEYKTVIAGSTHRGEDEIVLNVFSELKKEIPNLKLFIAPRHPERNNDVFELVKKTGFAAGKRSENSFFDQAEIILVDTMGELGKLYSVCDVAFIGGSFNQTGGHNPLEAAIFNKPVVSGPSVDNFKDIYAILTSSAAGNIVKTQDELKDQLKKLLTNKKYYDNASADCQTVFERNNGALGFVINVLQTIV
jgi:3-deoxy-D-manno-octulosonic-acid transferase